MEMNCTRKGRGQQPTEKTAHRRTFAPHGKGTLTTWKVWAGARNTRERSKTVGQRKEVQKTAVGDREHKKAGAEPQDVISSRGLGVVTSCLQPQWFRPLIGLVISSTSQSRGSE